ncbi:sigma-54-dependent Fis family transcriptional regulator [bacterium]|nr:sigma-54-dependent Fis family transcriptional regulator [bacterium]
MVPKIFLVEDNEMYSSALEHALQDEDYEIRTFYTGQEFINAINQGDVPDIVCLDHSLPDYTGLDLLDRLQKEFPKIASIFISGQEDVNVVVDAYKRGAKNYIVKNENTFIELKNAISNLVSTIDLHHEVELLREELSDRSKYKNIIGESTAILKVLKLIQRVEKTDTLVMITGDSGTGKELVAEAIHQNSNRRRKSFMAVNVAAIPQHLMEDELFGHERGAFTGASSKRKGKFEEANGGTIFLDEIGELELSLQTKLLRVLQEKKISRLGSNKLINLDVRIIAATNKNLGQLVKDGKFREDLYYRIQGFLIHLPPLKERNRDVLLLANHFLQEFTNKYNLGPKALDESAEQALLNHAWTGNVRELIALMDRVVLMSDGDTISKNDLIFSDSI